MLHRLSCAIIDPSDHFIYTTQCRPRSEAQPITGSPHLIQTQPESKSQPTQPTQVKAMPQPILKKSSAPQGETNKTTRLLLEQPDGGSITRNPSNSPTASIHEPKTKESNKGRQAPKKSQVTTGIRAGRRRPVFNRRKSSQTPILKSTSGTSNEQQQKVQPRARPNTDPLESMGSFELVFDPDYIPPITESPPTTTPTPTQTKEKIELAKIKEALADIGSIEVPRISSKTGTATTTSATTPNVASDQTDTLLSQGLETVSHDPQESKSHSHPGDSEKQRTEPNRSSDGTSEFLDSTTVPGFPGLRRIPMPEQMRTILLDILNDDSPLNHPIPLPVRPWWMFEHPWGPIPRRIYLKDWMLISEAWDKQPSSDPLIEPGFRTRFAEAIEALRAEEEETTAIVHEVCDFDSNEWSNDTDYNNEMYCSVLSQMVGNETQQNKSARREDLENELAEAQPDQQEQQVVFHIPNGDPIIQVKGAGPVCVESGDTLNNPPS